MIIETQARDLDSLQIPEGAYVETYTPAAGRVRSATLNNAPLKFCKVYIHTAGTLAFKSYLGPAIPAGATLPVGALPFLVSEITSGTAGFWILHDGVKQTGAASFTPDMTSDLVR